MRNVLREHGFVFVVGVLLIGLISYFIYDGNKYKINQKTQDGKDVVMSIDAGNVTADDLYETMMKENGVLLYNIYRNEVVNQSVKTTDSMEQEAKKLEENILSAAKNSDAQNYETILETELTSYGFKSIDDLYNYCLISVKEKHMNQKYVDAHLDELVGSVSEKHPRSVSIVTMDVANPDALTESEQKKKDDVDKSIESQGFAKTATAFSEDYSAGDQGIVGYIDDDSLNDSSASLPVEVITAALELEKDGTSDWISVSNDTLETTTLYKVHVDETDVKTLYGSKNDTIKDQLLYAIINNTQGLATNILQQNAGKVKVKFADESLQKQLEDTIAAQTTPAQEEEQEAAQ